jgi:hypothetical protein
MRSVVVSAWVLMSMELSSSGLGAALGMPKNAAYWLRI